MFEHVIFSYEIPSPALIHIVIVLEVVLLLTWQGKAEFRIPISLGVGSFAQPIPVATDVDATAAGHQDEREHGEINHVEADGRDGGRGGGWRDLHRRGDGGWEDGHAGESRPRKGGNDAHLG